MATLGSLAHPFGRLARLVDGGDGTRPVDAAPTPDPEADAAVEEYTVRLELNDTAADRLPRCLISYLEPLDENGADIVDAAVQGAREDGRYAVAVVCELRPDLSTSRDFPIDFLPRREHLPMLDQLSYARYIRRRWDIMLAKWDCGHHIQLGPSLDEFIAGQNR